MSELTARADRLSAEVSPIERWVRWRRRHREAIEAWLILTPILVYYSIFFIFPVVANIAVSFTRWMGAYGSPRWVGLDNFKAFLNYPYPITLFNTALFTVTVLAAQTTIAFFMAVLLNEKVLGRGLCRSMWYIPTLTSSAITAQVFFAFISPYDGVFNAVLKAVGHDPIMWTMNANWLRFFVMVYSVWRGVGTPMVLFLAALQGIHPAIYEAAMVDGANYWDRLRRITVPMLRPMVIFVLITGTVAGFQIFETVMLITAGGQANVASSGGPRNMTNVMLLQIYKDAFVNSNLGRAAAGSIITAILLLWFTTTNMRIMGRGWVGVD